MAQFGRVLGSGPRGRRFKSSHSDQGKTKAFCLRFLFIIGECRGFSADYAKKAGAEKIFQKSIDKRASL